MRRQVLSVLVLAAWAVLTGLLWQSCILDDQSDCPKGEFRVVFNWDSIGIPNYDRPEMGVLFYPQGSGGWWRYDLRPAGGVVPAPGQVFRTISYNDNIETVLISGNHSYDEIQGTTVNGQILNSFPKGLLREEPPVPDTSEPVHMCPTTMAVARSGWFRYMGTDTVQTLWPRKFTATYSVTVDRVDSISSAMAVSVALTGMSPGKYLASCRRMPGPVAYSSAMGIDAAHDRFTGTFNTFGPATDATQNMLYVYVLLVNGDKKIYAFDVTDQVLPHSDSLDVSIHVGGIKLPDVEPSGDVGSMEVGVSGWEVIHVTISND